MTVANESSIHEALVKVTADLTKHVRLAPTDLGAVAQKLNVAGWHSEQLAITGELRRVGGHLHIVYASGLSQGRRRFTVAHELGHAFLESTGKNAPRHGLEVEEMCDMFAVHLLMPEGAVRDFFHIGVSPDTVLRFADVFQVSLAAAIRRCEELELAYLFLVDSSMSVLSTTGPIRRIDVDIDEVVQEVFLGSNVARRVFLKENAVWNGQWQLNGIPLAGGKRALFALDPVPSPQPKAKTLVGQ
jgi:hypothetical protein